MATSPRFRTTRTATRGSRHRSATRPSNIDAMPGTGAPADHELRIEKRKFAGAVMGHKQRSRVGLLAAMAVVLVACGGGNASGATVMVPVTTFSNANALITLQSFAQPRSLTTIAQLKSVPFSLKFGDYAAGRTRYAGYAGLQQAYRLTNLEFVPLPTGESIYNAR